MSDVEHDGGQRVSDDEIHVSQARALRWASTGGMLLGFGILGAYSLLDQPVETGPYFTVFMLALGIGVTFYAWRCAPSPRYIADEVHQYEGGGGS